MFSVFDDPFFTRNRLRSFFPLIDEIDRMEQDIWDDQWMNNQNLIRSAQPQKQITEGSSKKHGKKSKELKEKEPVESKSTAVTAGKNENGQVVPKDETKGNDWLSSLFSGYNVQKDIQLKLEDQEGKYLLHATLPNFNKDQLQLQVKDGLLTISGEQVDEKRDEHSYSKSSRYVSRSMRLPENVDEDSIGAKWENNTLNISLPKLDKPKQKKDTIMIE